MNAATKARAASTKDDVALLIKIRDRALELAATLGYTHYRNDAGGLFLDLLNVHDSVGLQLRDLLAADDGQFGHDVFGIHRHFNRETRQLENGFCPRFVTPQSQCGRAPAHSQEQRA